MPKGIMMSSEPKLTGHLANATLQGMSAYEVAVRRGFTGTEIEWLASLKGDAGFNPVVDVTKSGDTATLTVTDATHTTEVNIVDGYTPQKNVDYFDGHTPVITATKSGTVTTIKSDGTDIVTINDGVPGPKGDPVALNFHICSPSEYNSETLVPTITNPVEDVLYVTPNTNSMYNLYHSVNGQWILFQAASLSNKAILG